MRTLSTVARGLVPVLVAVGCGGGPSLGSPEAPTSQQMSANTQLGSSTTDLVAIKAGGEMGQAKVLGLQGLMAGIGPTGTKTRVKVGLPFPLGPEPLSPSYMPAGCATSSGASSTFNMCKSDDGQTTINGSVTVTGDTIAVDLTISTTNQANVSIKLKGNLTVTATTINGTLTYDIEAGVGGIAAAGFHTMVDYRMVTFAGGCITNGSVYIEYKTTGIEQAAEFVYTGCGAFMVKNAQ